MPNGINGGGSRTIRILVQRQTRGPSPAATRGWGGRVLGDEDPRTSKSTQCECDRAKQAASTEMKHVSTSHRLFYERMNMFKHLSWRARALGHGYLLKPVAPSTVASRMRLVNAQ